MFIFEGIYDGSPEEIFKALSGKQSKVSAETKLRSQISLAKKSGNGEKEKKLRMVLEKFTGANRKSARSDNEDFLKEEFTAKNGNKVKFKKIVGIETNLPPKYESWMKFVNGKNPNLWQLVGHHSKKEVEDWISEMKTPSTPKKERSVTNYAENIKATKKLIKLIDSIGLGFHPDTPFSDYVENGVPVYTKTEARKLDKELEEIKKTLGAERFEDFVVSRLEKLQNMAFAKSRKMESKSSDKELLKQMEETSKMLLKRAVEFKEPDIHHLATKIYTYISNHLKHSK